MRPHTKRQWKKWRKRRQHVNARRKMANRAHNNNKWAGITDENTALTRRENHRQSSPLIAAITTAINKMFGLRGNR